jgi:hypothetical protein
MRVYGIAGIYKTIAVPAVLGIVEDRQREKTVRVAAWRLRGQVAEQLREVVNSPVPVSV